MRAATHAQQRRLAALTNELATLRLDAPCPFDQLLSDARDLLGSDSIGMYSVAETPAGWNFDRYHVSSDPKRTIRDGMLQLFARSNVPVLFYDFARPAPDQRNRLIEAVAMIDRTVRGGWKNTPLYREVLRPVGIGDVRQHRILLCEGASLLAWFGALHDGPLTVSQQRVLHALARAVGRRLRTERRLVANPRSLAALDAALEHIGAPAFIVRAGGVILTQNDEGRRLLDSSRDVLTSLHDALRGRPSTPAFDLTEIGDRGVPTCWLAIARRSRDAALAEALTRATTRWQLTRRQSQVLDLVLRGLTNEAIAAELALGARAIELHVSALLVRAGAASRAALVSAALLS